MGWGGRFILKGTVGQDDFFDVVQRRFAKRVASIHKQEYDYPAEDTLELTINSWDSPRYDWLRLWLPTGVWEDTLLLCALIGPHWTEVGVEERGGPSQTLDEVKHWIANVYDGFLTEDPWCSVELPEWYGIELPDEKIQRFYDQLTAEWFAEKYGMAWPPPFPVGNPQVEANYEPDWSRKVHAYVPPQPEPEVKRPKLGSKRQKPHGKRHER